MTTTDLTKFGYRERKMAEELLHSWNEDGLPENFDDDEVTIMLNLNSGNVFLTNSEFQVAMMNGESLEIFYTDPETGEEGFLEELSSEALLNLGLLESEEVDLDDDEDEDNNDW
tara:strand:+ start:174 stop:515 length:342 start_codon:yes stop_codon:yes gene_type:complete